MTGSNPSDFGALCADYLTDCQRRIGSVDLGETRGRLTHVAGLVLEAVGVRLPLGGVCLVEQRGAAPVETEVVGFSGDRLFLMPVGEVSGVYPGAAVRALEPRQPRPRVAKPWHPLRRATDMAKHLPVGERLLGRVLDGAGRPLDGLGPVAFDEVRSLQSRPINPIERSPISATLDVGVRAINGLLTVGRGQRLGLFAGSGVGKSVLLGMMARYTRADVIVVALIGERGREVKEFIEQILGNEGLARSIVVAAPADTPALLRLQGAAYATTIAEHFRDRGQHVLLLMDSLTRYAMAQREIALAVGEPPATKGYPPSVFARLPRLVERTGNGVRGGGSITAFYTVLTEGDDMQDPIGDAARAILDGHIALSRDLAESGHYPAIDIEGSISRAMQNLVPQQHLERVRRFKRLYSRYRRDRDLINVGAYAAGSDPLLDQAIAAYPRLEAYLQQDMHARVDYPSATQELEIALATPTPTAPGGKALQ
ncbi:MAG TPA: flagellar protein export ATPase FliI [Casimicrobiaceae bacterium]|nr:flagellar protein export ATPase FliI [Casimicrobiaceae bacterium]